MRLHDRYLFRELLTPLAYILGGFLVFWISFFFFTELEHMQESKLHAFDCIEYCVAMTPGTFVMVLPFTLLLALLYALTHHSRYNEITALRAAGVSLWRLCAPYFIIGLLAAGIYFALNELVVPRGDAWADQILNRYVHKGSSAKNKTQFGNNDFHFNQSHRTWHFSGYDAVTTGMLNPYVTWTLPDGLWSGLRAERADYTNGVWTFFDVQKFAQSQTNESFVALFPTNQTEMAMPEFVETPEQILLEIRFSDAEGLLKSRSVDIPLTALWPYLHGNNNIPAKEKARLLTKFHGRIAAPWTCLVVVLIAIPFGIQPGRKNLFFGVAGSIFICFAFFILQQVGLAMGMNDYLPGWLAAWLPNLIFAALGIFLTLRIR
jgi:lipopolysaccharide export system permease protein